uniref:Uncharacterized protein n=1 Tax=Glossina pallidipes TaxID=7398 RepID=A0A1A9ZTD3_GLOPL
MEALEPSKSNTGFDENTLDSSVTLIPLDRISIELKQLRSQLKRSRKRKQQLKLKIKVTKQICQNKIKSLEKSKQKIEKLLKLRCVLKKVLKKRNYIRYLVRKKRMERLKAMAQLRESDRIIYEREERALSKRRKMLKNTPRRTHPQIQNINKKLYTSREKHEAMEEEVAMLSNKIDDLQIKFKSINVATMLAKIRQLRELEEDQELQVPEDLKSFKPSLKQNQTSSKSVQKSGKLKTSSIQVSEKDLQNFENLRTSTTKQLVASKDSTSVIGVIEKSTARQCCRSPRFKKKNSATTLLEKTSDVPTQTTSSTSKYRRAWRRSQGDNETDSTIASSTDDHTFKRFQTIYMHKRRNRSKLSGRSGPLSPRSSKSRTFLQEVETKKRQAFSKKRNFSQKLSQKNLKAISEVETVDDAAVSDKKSKKSLTSESKHTSKLISQAEIADGARLTAGATKIQKRKKSKGFESRNSLKTAPPVEVVGDVLSRARKPKVSKHKISKFSEGKNCLKTQTGTIDGTKLTRRMSKTSKHKNSKSSESKNSFKTTQPIEIVGDGGQKKRKVKKRKTKKSKRNQNETGSRSTTASKHSLKKSSQRNLVLVPNLQTIPEVETVDDTCDARAQGSAIRRRRGLKSISQNSITRHKSATFNRRDSSSRDTPRRDLSLKTDLSTIPPLPVANLFSSQKSLLGPEKRALVKEDIGLTSKINCDPHLCPYINDSMVPPKNIRRANDQHYDTSYGDAVFSMFPGIFQSEPARDSYKIYENWSKQNEDPSRVVPVISSLKSKSAPCSFQDEAPKKSYFAIEKSLLSEIEAVKLKQPISPIEQNKFKDFSRDTGDFGNSWERKEENERQFRRLIKVTSHELLEYLCATDDRCAFLESTNKWNNATSPSTDYPQKQAYVEQKVKANKTNNVLKHNR